MVLEKISKEKCNDSAVVPVSRASLITNMLHEFTVLSSFQMVRGYSPSIIGLPAIIVPEELFNAHIQLTAHRALQKAITSRHPNHLTKDDLPFNTKMWVFYNTSKQNEWARWLLATVSKAERHIVYCRRSEKGPPLTVVYEHVRLAPKGELANDLMNLPLEDKLSKDTSESTNEYQSMALRKSAFHEDTPSEGRSLMGDDDNSDVEKCDTLLPVGVTESSPLTTDHNGNPTNDIGNVSACKNPEHSKSLQSDGQRVLQEIKDVIGSEQDSQSKLVFAPPWIINKSIDAEVSSNWTEAYTEVNANEIAGDANTISSHIVSKLETEGKGKMRLKSRVCSHENEDKFKNDVRKDSATAQFDVIRL